MANRRGSVLDDFTSMRDSPYSLAAIRQNNELVDKQRRSGKITSVERMTPCNGCKSGRVKVTFATGDVTVIHDDGTFWEYTGEQS